MRAPVALLLAVAALAASGSAFAAGPSEGVLVFKTVRVAGVDGRLVSPAGSTQGSTGTAEECRDASFVLAGPRWKNFEDYHVNIGTAPNGLDRLRVLRDLLAAHEAWEAPFVTECRRHRISTSYRARFGGLTNRTASLVSTGRRDGVNAVAFQSLAGTVCDGAAACVVLDFEKGRIREADLAFERELTRYGFQDFWTTDDTTWFDETGGRWSISDTATHEFGHFAGLDHVDASPALTMYTFVHDGGQTLGLGDMLGMAALYGSRRDRDDDRDRDRGRDDD
jgi:Matrixin